MKRAYPKVVRRDSRELASYLAREGQFLFPLVELIEGSSRAIDEVVDVVGRAAIEAVLLMSAQRIAGPKGRGRRKSGDVCWYASQRGTVTLSDRKVRIERPRLRRRGQGRGGEVEIPAYEAMRESPELGRRMLEILLAGVSTRQYQRVIPEMAETVGVSRSSVSREAMEASAEKLKSLAERRFDDVDLLVIYVDGIRFGEHHVIAAVGVDRSGKKYVLGVRDGASENAAVVTALLEDLVARGVDTKRCRLFVIDGSKALRRAIHQVFGRRHYVQRCRAHKLRNVTEHLPRHLRAQTMSAMRAAYRLGPKEGIPRLEKMATWLDKEHPGAAASLREGLEETFTVARLGLSPSLLRCLTSTNVIENSHGGLRQKTRRVTRWKDGAMVMRWAASALLATEKTYRKVLGYKDLWQLEAVLNGKEVEEQKAA